MSVRIAVVCDAARPRAWHVRCVEEAAAGGASIAGVKIAAVGAATGDATDAGGSGALARVAAPASWLLRETVGDAPAAAAGPEADVVLYLGDGEPPPAIANRARYGVWWYRMRKPVAFWELLAGETVVQATLEREGTGAIKAGWFAAIAHSRGQTVDTVCYGAASWVAQACREVDAGLPLDRALAVVNADAAAPGREPSSWDRMALRLALARRALTLRLGYLFRHEHWNVGVIDAPIERVALGGVARDVRWLAFPKSGRFAADPFGRQEASGIAVCCEEYDYRERRGFLSAARVAAGQNAVDWRPIVREPYHLSYPYLIEHEGRAYCCPEMSEAGEIALYEATDFPFAWERRTTLVRGFPAADSTIFTHEGRYWLLCTRAGAGADNTCLYAFHADDLFGPWSAHVRNPVKVDARSARPGGTPFLRDGRLHRPAQDCAGGYGRRIAIMHVRALTPTEFDETPVAWVEPDPHGPCPDGLHTLSAAGGATLIDGKYHRFVVSEFARAIARYAGLATRAPRVPSKGKEAAAKNAGTL